MLVTLFTNFGLRFLDTHCEDSRGSVLSIGHCHHYGVVFFMTQLSKPDTKPVNHRFQKALFSEVLHLPLDDTGQTDSKRGTALVSVIILVQDFW